MAPSRFPYNVLLQIKSAVKMGRYTREQALAEIAVLLDIMDGQYDYGPLLRLSDVCQVLREWARLFGTELSEDAEWKKEERKRFREAWSTIDLAISKSNLLARVFFNGEQPRTTPCPVHKGRWSGCDFSASTPRGPCGCYDGMNVTGWLPDNEIKLDCGHLVTSVNHIVKSEHGELCYWCYDNWREFEGLPREFSHVSHSPAAYDQTLVDAQRPYKKPEGYDAIP